MASITFPNGNKFDFLDYGNYAFASKIIEQSETSYHKFYTDDVEPNIVCYSWHGDNLFIYGNEIPFVFLAVASNFDEYVKKIIADKENISINNII